MSKTHIIYIPGLGDGYDALRRPLLKLWNRPNVTVEHVPSHWSDQTEDYEGKLARIKQAIDRAGDAKVVLVGESAGGALSLVAARLFASDVDQVITLCGMNQGVGNVSPYLYKKNIAFRDVMLGADDTMEVLNDELKSKITTIYSAGDFTVRPKHTLIPGTKAIKLGKLGHFGTITYVLAFRGGLIRQLTLAKS